MQALPLERPPSGQKEPTEEYEEIPVVRGEYVHPTMSPPIREGFLRQEAGISAETEQQPVPSLSSVLYR